MYKHIIRDDRGLSLVELLVAVAILALVAIPLGRSFVASARTAARSEALGNAAEAARNIAETVVATDMDEIYRKMKEPVASLSGWSITNAATYPLDESAPSDTVSRSDPVCRFTLEGVSYASRQYDAVVTLRADPAKNSVSIPQYTPMDAVFNQAAQPQEPDEAANDYFDIPGRIPYGAQSTTTRNIVLTLYGDETGVSADISYNYTCSVTIDDKTLPSFDISRSYSVVGESDIGDDNKTPAVYIMYTPYNPQDHFTVNCTSTVPLPVFLAAQAPSGGLSAGYGISVTGSKGNAEIYANVPVTGGTSNIYASEQVDRLYAVTVELYAAGEAGTGDIIYTLESTKMD